MMIAYDRLSQIIPPDQALANKALFVSLSQITNIKSISLPGLASAYKNISTVKNLTEIETLAEPLPQSVTDYYANNYAIGSGTGNTLVLGDMIGTAAGIGYTDQFQTVTAIIDSLTASGNLTVLSGLYGDISNSINSVYGDAISGPVTIPSGPAAGTYLASFDGGGNVEVSAAETAITGIGGAATGIGCIPAVETAISSIISANTTAANNLNAAFDSMANSIVSENSLLNLANIVLTDIVPASAQASSGFIDTVVSYATDVQVGGPAQYLESVANVNDLGGQALIGALRQARNNLVLTTVGVVPNNTVDPVLPETAPTTLLPSTYNTVQAANLIVK